MSESRPARASRAVLITGCSSGIGRATAKRLAKRGWTVYATARDVATRAPLEERGCRLLLLDVTDEGSMRRAFEEVERTEGAVGVLVNNAGYSQSGAVEEVPMEDIRRQFETNVFGLVRMCQLVLPGMRRQGSGRIVNISSMGGRLTFRRGLLPRHQARRRGDKRLLALRGARLRGGGRGDRARTHPHQFRADGASLDGGWSADVDQRPLRRLRRGRFEKTREVREEQTRNISEEAIEEDRRQWEKTRDIAT